MVGEFIGLISEKIGKFAIWLLLSMLNTRLGIMPTLLVSLLSGSARIIPSFLPLVVAVFV